MISPVVPTAFRSSWGGLRPRRQCSRNARDSTRPQRGVEAGTVSGTIWFVSESLSPLGIEIWIGRHRPESHIGRSGRRCPELIA